MSDTTNRDLAAVTRILGYSAEVCEPGSRPITAYYTDRYMNPVRERLVKYIKDQRHEVWEQLAKKALLLDTIINDADEREYVLLRDVLDMLRTGDL